MKEGSEFTFILFIYVPYMTEDLNQDKIAILFAHLVISFQTAAMQQLGKLPNPASGKMERDLNQARSTIDMLDMLAVKSKGNLSVEEDKFISQTISELKLNYVDECSSQHSTSEETLYSEHQNTDFNSGNGETE